MALPNMLIIEDDEANIFGYNKLLAKSFNLTFTTSILETKVLLDNKNINFDIILLDIGLPDGLGIDLLPLLTNLFKLVIITSANEDPDVLKQIPQSIPFFLKPISIYDLLNLIESSIYEMPGNEINTDSNEIH